MSLWLFSLISHWNYKRILSFTCIVRKAIIQTPNWYQSFISGHSLPSILKWKLTVLLSASKYCLFFFIFFHWTHENLMWHNINTQIPFQYLNAAILPMYWVTSTIGPLVIAKEWGFPSSSYHIGLPIWSRGWRGSTCIGILTYGLGKGPGYWLGGFLQGWSLPDPWGMYSQGEARWRGVAFPGRQWLNMLSIFQSLEEQAALLMEKNSWLFKVH